MWRDVLDITAAIFSIATPILVFVLYLHWLWRQRHLETRFTVQQQSIARAILEVYSGRGTGVLSSLELKDELKTRGLPAADIDRLLSFFEEKGFLKRRRKSLDKGQPPIDVLYLKSARRVPLLQASLDRHNSGASQ
jgi:hypothetical protein